MPLSKETNIFNLIIFGIVNEIEQLNIFFHIVISSFEFFVNVENVKKECDIYQMSRKKGSGK